LCCHKDSSGSESFRADYGQSLPPFTFRAGTNKAETDVVVAVVRVVVVPVRHIAVGSIVVPRAATVDTVVTGSRACLTFFVGNCPE